MRSEPHAQACRSAITARDIQEKERPAAEDFWITNIEWTASAAALYQSDRQSRLQMLPVRDNLERALDARHGPAGEKRAEFQQFFGKGSCW